MPRNLPQFTRCAAPGVAEPISVPSVLLTLVSVGVIGYLAAVSIGIPCAGAVAAALGLIAALDAVEDWYYNRRLMCILDDQCAIGTVVGAPLVACDGDAKLDILIAPFGFQEVDRKLLVEAITGLVPATLPAPTNDINDRNDRLTYVNGLTKAQAKALYVALVNDHMLNPATQPGRDFQGHYFIKRQPPMPADAAAHTADDNPMFRFDADDVPAPGFIDGTFCDWLLDVPSEDVDEHRLVPYMHCEIEGNRVQRGLTNLKLAIAAFAAAYATFCALCNAIIPGAGVLLCNIVAGLVGLLFAWLMWLLSKLFNDPDDGEAGSLPIDLPDPTAPDDTSSAARGDVVLAFGNWIKDTEHNEYFEIHPVKAWYTICRDPDGAATTVNDVDAPSCGFDVTSVDQAMLDEMCGIAVKAETEDPVERHTADTAGALSVVGGLR
jgi:hypothetical protein